MRRKKRLEEQKEVSEVKSKAKAAAQKVKDQQAEIPAVFKVDIQKFIDEKSMEPFTEHSGDFPSFDVEKPCIFKNQTAIDSWIRHRRSKFAWEILEAGTKRLMCSHRKEKRSFPFMQKKAKKNPRSFLTSLFDIMSPSTRCLPAVPRSFQSPHHTLAVWLQ